MSSQAHSALYQLCPLPQTSRWIRVLELAAPSPTDNNNAAIKHLSGILRVVDLSENPRFTALSYVWGPPGPHTITCNGIQLPITTNCHDALKALRRRYGNLTIWIDAICINQQDGLEKNSQVSLMGEIYSWAETVYVWLGNGNQASDAAMDCFEFILSNLQCLQPARCSATLDKYARAREALRFIGREFWFIVDISQLSTRKSRRKFNEAYRVEDFNELLDTEWIQRMWTFQEIFLAHNPVIIRGSKARPLDDFMRGIANIGLVHSHPQVDKDRWGVLNLYYWQNYQIGSIPKKSAAWASIFTVWMHINRDCQRNDQQMRRRFGPEQPSTSDYQRPSFYMYQWQLTKRVVWIRLSTQIFLVLALIGLFVFSIELRNMMKSLDDLATILSIVSSIFVLLPLGMTVILLRDALGPRRLLGLASYIFNGEEKGTDMDKIMLPAIYRAIRERNATNPRDRLYAILGILQNLGVQVPAVSYATSIGEVYHELFLTLDRWGKIPNIILDAGIPTFPNTPSWVPDWTKPKQWIDDSLYIYGSGQGATVSSTPAWQIEQSGTILKVKGCRRGRVLFCSDRFVEANDTDNEKDFANLRVFFQALCAIRLHATPMHYTISDIFFEVLYARTLYRIDTEVRLLFKKWYQILLAATVNNTDIETQTRICLAALRQTPHLLSYHKARCNDMAKSNRLFFATTHGAIGTGSCYIAPGDHVVLIAGVSMPVIIRSVVGQHSYNQLVGPCFIHQMMRGERWSGKDLDYIELV